MKKITLLKLIDNSGFTLGELGIMLQVDRVTVWRWATGRTLPSNPRKLSHLLRLVGGSIDKIKW